MHMGFIYKGGGERIVIEEAKGLRRRGHQVRIFSPIIRWDKTYPELKRVGAERLVPSLPLPFPFRESSALFASALIPFGIERLRDCDVMLCHSQPSLWIGWRMNQIYGIPYVGYLHQLTTFIHGRPHIAGNWKNSDFAILETIIGRGITKSIIRWLDKLSHQKASRLLFNSAHTKGLFQREYGVTGEVCYPGISRPANVDVPRSHTRLFMVARQYPWKRIDLALQVVKRLQQYKGIGLTVAGSKTELCRWLVSLARHMGLLEIVSFIGEVSSETLIRHYATAAVYVQTSIYEPFGMSSLEAQSYGTPAVVWGDAGLKETVLDGKTGFHAKPYDIDDFASKVGYLIENRSIWSEMSENAKQWATDTRFSWERHIDTLEKTLLSAAS